MSKMTGEEALILFSFPVWERLKIGWQDIILSLIDDKRLIKEIGAVRSHEAKNKDTHNF